MQAANVLLQRAAPRNRHGQKKRVEARIVEALADVATSGQQNSCLGIWDCRQLFGDAAPLFYAHATFQHDDPPFLSS